MVDLKTLKARLRQVREELETLRRPTLDQYLDEYRLLNAERLRLESAIGIALGQETAQVIPWTPKWDVGASLVHIVSRGPSPILLYRTHPAPDPDWDGQSVTLVGSQTPSQIAVVKFLDCTSYKIGSPNDEVLHGHPLENRGLSTYEAHEIINSSWLASIEAINAVHNGYNYELWRKKKHHLLSFKDETFECLANDYTIQLIEANMSEALRLVLEQEF